METNTILNYREEKSIKMYLLVLYCYMLEYGIRYYITIIYFIYFISLI